MFLFKKKLKNYFFSIEKLHSMRYTFCVIFFSVWDSIDKRKLGLHIPVACINQKLYGIENVEIFFISKLEKLKKFYSKIKIVFDLANSYFNLKKWNFIISFYPFLTIMLIWFSGNLLKIHFYKLRLSLQTNGNKNYKIVFKKR